MFFKSATRKDSFVAVYSVKDRNNNPIITNLTTTLGPGQNIEINLITSLYGKKTSSLQAWADNDLLIYKNDLKKMNQRFLLGCNCQSDVTSSNKNKLLLKSSVVKN